uniref:Uncharacterized protein n=1 Tax=Trepomonas sp. PC1 TaxID=1076344 RepID=A0A146KMP4_9EUKA|eukprot:JAP96586.1 hypothetical protein TPC1_10026 [Trepomonas sp. PC1]
MAAMFWNMIYGQNGNDSKDIQQFVQSEDIESLLKHDRIKQEIQNGSSSVTQFLAKPNSIIKMIDYLYDADDEPVKRQLNTTVNDIFMSENSIILEAIANNPDYILKVFQVLLPYNDEHLRKSNTDELQVLPPESRRVPQICAENFCRLVFTLIKNQSRFTKVLNCIKSHLEVMTWFAFGIQSAPVTETLHYVFKIDKNPDTLELQTQILIKSQFIEQLYSRFQAGGIFEELVHVAFVFQSFLTTEVKADVKRLIMTHLPQIAENTLTPTAAPYIVRNMYTIAAVTLKQAVKMGILAETEDDASFYANVLQMIMSVLVPKFQGYLSLEMEDGAVNPNNLYIVHTCTVIAEILKIQEATSEFIKEKEQLLLNQSYRPEGAIAYLTSFYKANATDYPLPFVVGFTFIFQDVYSHLYDTTKFKFDQTFTRQVTQIHQSPTKQTQIIHLFGPNKELCTGTVEHIISILAEGKIFQLLIDQAYQNPECGILHCDLLNILYIIAEYIPFQMPFTEQILNEELFEKLKAGVLGCSDFKSHASMEKIVVNGNQVKGIDQRAMLAPQMNSIKQRIEFQTKRVSLDALTNQIVKRAAIKGIAITPTVQFLAECFEIKEALGM